jgi:hypothetical protein
MKSTQQTDKGAGTGHMEDLQRSIQAEASNGK